MEHLYNLERKHKLGAVVEFKKKKLEQLGCQLHPKPAVLRRFCG